MPYQIFNSRITLSFRDKYYEMKYNQEITATRKKYNILTSVFLTCISIAFTIPMILEYSNLKEQLNSRYSAMLCYISTGLVFILTTSCIFIKNHSFQKWLTYLNYVAIFFVFSNLRYYCLYVLKTDIFIYTLLFIIEMKFRLMLFVVGLIDFVPGVYLQLIQVVFNISIFSPILPQALFFRFSIYAFLMMLMNLMSYFFACERKRSFYWNLSLKIKNSWYESIIDNMNSGFISIKDKEIQYHNQTLLGFLKKPSSSNEVALTNNEGFGLVNKININELFDNILFENRKIDAFHQIESILNERYKEVGDNFIFLGNKDIEVTPTSFINLEVFGRCYSSSHDKIDRHEFIFNDITRSKQIEQYNAEIKYKTLFLSKIAHEFKNPLICISELVEQVHDNMVANKFIKLDNNNVDILKQIKSLSSYLIILVKDMDYFSQKSTGLIEKKKIELDRISLSDIIRFCNDIVNALIQKSHKQANITFQVIEDKNLPPYITSDDIKLKQILINLLSNAVKYTYHGLISLKITLEQTYLRFQVEDTGKGISDMQMDKIFIPFSNEFDKLNKVSSGLGLSIVKELLEILGSKIEFSSTLGKGSSFWFSLELDDNDLNYNYISDSTIKGTHFNDLPIKARLERNSNLEAKYNIIVVDDDIVIRQAAIRLLQKSFKEKSLSVRLFEASDGIECLNMYYNLVKEGKTISFILSDETMIYMNGSYASQILDNISSHKNIVHVPFYILTAYENLDLGPYKEAINGIFSKPLRKQYIDELLNNFK
jgi:signal transduction histidine kinase/CheY-like chemotaxis protein